MSVYSHKYGIEIDDNSVIASIGDLGPDGVPIGTKLIFFFYGD